MIDISKEAVQQLKEYKEKNAPDSYIRIGIVSGTTSGASLGVVADDKKDKDTVVNLEGLDVLIDTALLQYCETISIEYIQQDSAACGSGAFKITPKNRL